LGLRSRPRLGSRLGGRGLRPSLRLRRLDLGLDLGPSRLRLSWLRRRLSGLGLLNRLGPERLRVVL